MEKEEVTIDGILAWFERAVEARHPIAASTYLDGCQKIIALLGNLDDEVVESEMVYRRLRAGFIEDGKSAAEGEARAKSSDAYRDFLKLRAKRERVQEFIQAAKARTRLPAWDME